MTLLKFLLARQAIAECVSKSTILECVSKSTIVECVLKSITFFIRHIRFRNLSDVRKKTKDNLMEQRAR